MNRTIIYTYITQNMSNPHIEMQRYSRLTAYLLQHPNNEE
jgi:hypothetical protein